jgi:prepilin-type N-terminal cleavage/methylation domain-containing protein
MTCPYPKINFCRSGLTLLELSLAMAIALTLAAVAIPAVGGWMEERAFRRELDDLAFRVMEVRREAEASGEARFILFHAKDLPLEKIAETTTVLETSPEFALLRRDRRGRWIPAGGSFFRIQPGGIVEPVVFRLERKESYIVFRFDPLTGHLDEQEFSF